MSKKQKQLDYQAIKLQKACSGHIPIETAYAFLETAYNLGRQTSNKDMVDFYNKARNTKYRLISQIKQSIILYI